MCDFRVRVVSGALCGSAVPILLGTSFIDKIVKVILLPKSKIIPYDSKPVQIHATNIKAREHKKEDEKAKNRMTTKLH